MLGGYSAYISKVDRLLSQMRFLGTCVYQPLLSLCSDVLTGLKHVYVAEVSAHKL